MRLEGWRQAPASAAILRDARRCHAPQDEGGGRCRLRKTQCARTNSFTDSQDGVRVFQSGRSTLSFTRVRSAAMSIWCTLPAAGEVERMRGGGAHRDARAHHAHARERRDVAVDAAPGRHDVVGLGRHEAAERHVVQVVVAERLPDIALGRSCSSIGQAVRAIASGNGPGAHVVDGQLLAPDDPARLADAEDARRCAPARCRTPPDIRLAGTRPPGRPAPCRASALLRGRDRVERRLDVRHVDQRGAAAGKHEREAVARTRP